MKTAIYIDDGCTQLVLTPETDIDNRVIAALESGSREGMVRCVRGQFYECRGGWVRQGNAKESLILRVGVRATELSGGTPDTDPRDAGATQ